MERKRIGVQTSVSEDPIAERLDLIQLANSARLASKNDLARVVIDKTYDMTNRGRALSKSLGYQTLFANEARVVFSAHFLDNLSYSVDDSGKKIFTTEIDPEKPISSIKSNREITKLLHVLSLNPLFHYRRYKVPAELRQPHADLGAELLAQLVDERNAGNLNK